MMDEVNNFKNNSFLHTLHSFEHLKM